LGPHRGAGITTTKMKKIKPEGGEEGNMRPKGGYIRREWRKGGEGEPKPC